MSTFCDQSKNIYKWSEIPCIIWLSNVSVEKTWSCPKPWFNTWRKGLLTVVVSFQDGPQWPCLLALPPLWSPVPPHVLVGLCDPWNTTEMLSCLLWVWVIKSLMALPSSPSQSTCSGEACCRVVGALSVGRGHQEHLCSELDPGSQNPVLGMYILSPVPTVGALSRMPPWESNEGLRPSVKTSVYELLGSWARTEIASSTCPRQASYVSSLAD